MSDAIFFGCLWVLAAAAVAFLPLRYQFRPGLLLLLIAPVLMIWIALAHGWLLGLAGLAAFVLMFRNPLLYSYRRLTGDIPEGFR